MFKVGDSIFYPMHGAGKIKCLEEKDFSGEKQPYYTIQMVIGDVKEIASTIKEQETEKRLPWRQRYKTNMDKIKSGHLEDSADIIHALLQMQKEDKLK